MSARLIHRLTALMSAAAASVVALYGCARRSTPAPKPRAGAGSPGADGRGEPGGKLESVRADGSILDKSGHEHRSS